MPPIFGAICYTAINNQNRHLLVNQNLHARKKLSQKPHPLPLWGPFLSLAHHPLPLWAPAHFPGLASPSPLLTTHLLWECPPSLSRLCPPLCSVPPLTLTEYRLLHLLSFTGSLYWTIAFRVFILIFGIWKKVVYGPHGNGALEERILSSLPQGPQPLSLPLPMK